MMAPGGARAAQLSGQFTQCARGEDVRQRLRKSWSEDDIKGRAKSAIVTCSTLGQRIVFTIQIERSHIVLID